MQRVVSFYEKLPRGPAPEVKAKGFLGRYQAKHFGKNPTVKRTSILVGFRQRERALPGSSLACTCLVPGQDADTLCDAAIVHALVFLLAIGYAQNYYFHLREYTLVGAADAGMDRIGC